MLRTALVLGCLSLLIPHGVLAKTVDINLESDSVIELHGPISWDAVNPIVETILTNPTNVRQFTLVVNSPGGEIYSGLHLVNAMNMAKQRGIKFRCVSTFLAASMAYQIFSACDTRIALKGTLLLWHPPRVSVGGGVALTPRLATELADDLRRIEKILITDLQRWMRIPRTTFFKHYHAETLWVASELSTQLPGWIEIVDDVVGIRSLDMSKSNKTRSGIRLTYIWSGIGVGQ